MSSADPFDPAAPFTPRPSGFRLVAEGVEEIAQVHGRLHAGAIPLVEGAILVGKAKTVGLAWPATPSPQITAGERYHEDAPGGELDLAYFWWYDVPRPDPRAPPQPAVLRLDITLQRPDRPPYALAVWFDALRLLSLLEVVARTHELLLLQRRPAAPTWDAIGQAGGFAVRFTDAAGRHDLLAPYCAALRRVQQARTRG